MDRTDHFIDVSETFVRVIEVVVAYLLVVLFAIGVVDIIYQIILRIVSGRITNPAAIIALLDKVLLLFIIVELHQTVVAYSRGSDQTDVVTTALYAGVIAMIRKIILFRTGEYQDGGNALIAAGSYLLILAGLALLLFVIYVYSE
jgi:uncharacterized membrane protein (DUF373 family)